MNQVYLVRYLGHNLHPSRVSFPFYIRIGDLRLHPHTFFETLAYLVALTLFLILRRRQGDRLSDDSRWWIISAAVVGAALACRLIGWFELLHRSWYAGGKTIVGGLIGGSSARRAE